MRTVTFSVDDMRCRRCVRRATALVRDVQAVTADAKSGLFTVRGTMTGIDIVRSLRNTTFTARLIDEEPKPEF